MPNTGWKYAGLVVDQGGPQAWADAANAAGNNLATFAACSMPAATSANDLMVTQFNFSDLPAEAEIDGIESSVWVAEGLAGFALMRSDLQLVINGTNTGETKNIAQVDVAPGEYVLGDATDKWFLSSPTGADFKHSNSGVLVEFANDPADPSEARLYRVGLRLHYSIPLGEGGARLPGLDAEGQGKIFATGGTTLPGFNVKAHHRVN